MRSLFTDVLALAGRGDRVNIFDETGNAMIGDGRGLMVSKFLESDGTHLVFVDSDVAWEAGALVRLVDHPVDFVAGLYPQRKDPINYCCQWDTSKKEIELSEDGLIEVYGVPAGFMRCSRAMLERMVEAFPDSQFYCREAPNETVHNLFGEYRVGKIKFGEDYAFCRRWRDIGGKVWIDPNITMGHVGFKTFMGNVSDWLKGQGDGDS